MNNTARTKWISGSSLPDPVFMYPAGQARGGEHGSPFLMMQRVFYLFSGLLLLLSVQPVNAEWYLFEGSAMTTRVQLEVWCQDEVEAESIRQAVFSEFDRIDHLMSRYRDDSELSRVNREAADHPVVVSGELFQILKQALNVSRLSHGAFDISFASVGYLYDYRKKKQPSEHQIEERLPHINYHAIVLNDSDHTVRFREKGVVLDLGGIAKGYAVDRGMAIVKAHGVLSARLSAGGDMLLLGDKRGKPWIVGVRDPRSEEANAVLLPLSDVAVSTSGDYERFFIDDNGERVHHIISPKTGRPAQGVQSVTILGPDATTTDGLSTAVFVLGTQEGLAMINRLPGIDAIIIDSERKMHYSEGLVPPEASQ
ncbi:FAD:protein FMN transferase [Marinobacteraceae bacterium S3BR75-40.1]